MTILLIALWIMGILLAITTFSMAAPDLKNRYILLLSISWPLATLVAYTIGIYYAFFGKSKRWRSRL